MSVIEKRLFETGLEVPVAQPSVANCVSALIQGDLLFVSGQLPLEDGKVRFQGRVGTDLGIEDGKLSAQLCALSSDSIVVALAESGRHVRAAVGCTALPLNAATEVEVIFAIRN